MKRVILLLFWIFVLLFGFMQKNTYCDESGYYEKHEDDNHKWYERFKFWDDDDHYEEHDEDSYGKHEKYKYKNRHTYKTKQISAVQAKKIVSDSIENWKFGDGWEKRNKAGGMEIIIPIEHDGQFIGEIKVSSETGEILSKELRRNNPDNYHAGFLPEFKAHPPVHSEIGYAPADATPKSNKKTSENYPGYFFAAPKKAISHQTKSNVTIYEAREIVQKSLSKIVVSDMIRIGKRNFWKVPLLLNKIEIEEIRVGMGTGKILPDLRIEKESY